MEDMYKYRFIQQMLYPSMDKEQWLAFLTLKERYEHLTYMSYDGYSCDGLADYTKNIVWVKDEIIDWTTKDVIEQVKVFWECSSTEICSVWMKVNGETHKTKMQWLDSF